MENGYKFYQPGGSTFYGSIQFDTLTSNQNYDFPDKSGTVALLDDITAGVSSSANNVLVDEESNVDADRVILFADAGDGVRRLKSDDSDLKYNPNSNTLIAGRFSGSGAGLSSIPASQLDGTLPNEVFPEVLPAVDGSNLTGVAASEAKKLQTPRTISLSGNATGSVQFDGSQDVDIAVAVNTTNSFGITLSDEGTDSTTFLAFSNQATGSSIPLKTNSNLTFDSTDGTLSASFFDGDGSQLTGINASNVTISGAGNTEQVQRVLLASGTGSTSIVNDGGIFYKPSSNKLTVIGTVSAGSFEGDGSNLTGITAADADFADVAGVATNVNGGIVTATTVSAAGSITAANFYGDGSNLIGVSAGDADFADVAGVATNVNGGIATVTKLDSPNTIVSIGANLIPDANEAYDLGSATNRFNDLYLSGNTIDLGGIQLRSVANNLGVGGTQVVLQGQDFTGNAATATTATRAETVEVASSETGGNENARLTFVVDGVDPDLNRFDALNINTQLRFNRTAGRLYATEFQGDGSRLTNVTAGVATDVDLNQDTTSATEKRLIFGANGSNGSQRLEVDTSLDGIRYVPSTSTLFVSNIEANLVGNITGTATTATRAETVDVASVGNNTARYLTFVDSSGTADGQQVRVNSQIQAIAGTGKLIANNFQGGGGLLTALNASQLTEGTVPAARITDIGDVNANVITLLNVEKDDLSADGQFGFDSSQGLLVYRTQQGAPTPDGATTTVLDGWNVRAGTGISITNLGAGGSGTQAFTFSIDSNASIENAIRAQTVDIQAYRS